MRPDTPGKPYRIRGQVLPSFRIVIPEAVVVEAGFFIKPLALEADGTVRGRVVIGGAAGEGFGVAPKAKTGAPGGAGAVFGNQLSRGADVVGDDVVQVLALQLGERAEAAGFMDSNPLRSRLAGGSSCELAIRLSKNVGQHIRINPALFERSGGEILSGLQLIVAKGQAMGTVECNNAPQNTRDLRMGVEEQFPLQQGLTGWDGLDSRRRNSSETLELKQRRGRPVGARCGDDDLGHARNVSVLSHQTSP